MAARLLSKLYLRGSYRRDEAVILEHGEYRLDLLNLGSLSVFASLLVVVVDQDSILTHNYAQLSVRELLCHLLRGRIHRNAVVELHVRGRLLRRALAVLLRRRLDVRGQCRRLGIL